VLSTSPGERPRPRGVGAKSLFRLVLGVVDAVECGGVENGLGAEGRDAPLHGVGVRYVETAVVESDRAAVGEHGSERPPELAARTGDDDRPHSRTLSGKAAVDATESFV